MYGYSTVSFLLINVTVLQEREQLQKNTPVVPTVFETVCTQGQGFKVMSHLNMQIDIYLGRFPEVLLQLTPI